MSDAYNLLMEIHIQVCFENGDHPDEIDTPYSLGANAIAYQSRTEELGARLTDVTEEKSPSRKSLINFRLTNG